jgi:hypothetical protein
MPRKGKGIYSDVENAYEEWMSDINRTNRQQLKEFAREYKAKGPIVFAEKVLRIDPNTGGPLVLSDDQKLFLEDMWLNDVRLAIISAGRGSGKTFILAVYCMWRIFTHEYYNISVMGGSAEQSNKLHAYMTGWIRANSDTLKKAFIWKDIEGEIRTYLSSATSFHSCSATSVRGPHTREIIIDEEAAGEEHGGTKYIKAALWEVSTSPDIHIIKSSTPHYVHGDFLETWNDFEKLGFKRYRWAIARHINGEQDPYKIYEDTISSHWIANVPWTNDKAIQILRRIKSNDEWLVEGLGAMSIASGLVFKPEDIESCICKRCPNGCKPWEEGYCAAAQYYLNLEGVESKNIPLVNKDALKLFTQRIMGIDWGRVSPDSYAVTGKFGDTILVLEHLEVVGQNDQDKIEKAMEYANRWFTDMVRPDPREWSFNNALRDRGLAVHELFSFTGGDEKKEYLYTTKKVIERHHLVIPSAFTNLIRSLKNLTYDEDGKVRKVDDHSFDSLMYAISYYGETGEVQEMEQRETGRKEPEKSTGAPLWKPEEDSRPPPPSDFDPFNEEYLKKKRRDNNTPEDGGNIW